MVDIVSLVFIGISAFVTTNIDDIFILVMFFASSSLIYPVKHVVLGQYLGISLLVAISALGSFLPLIIPTHLIGTVRYNINNNRDEEVSSRRQKQKK